MKRKILCLLLLIFLTGCSTEYNLEFKDGKFKDNVKIGQFDSNKIGDFDTLEPVATYVDKETQYYALNYKDNYLYLNHEYTINDYKKAAALIECFDKYEITDDEKYYYIHASGEFKCLSYLGYKNDSVKVNFTTDLKVESNNADSISNNVYTWTFNDNNYKNKEIIIKLIKKNNKGKIIIASILCILLIMFILYKRLKKHINDKNKIPD